MYFANFGILAQIDYKLQYRPTLLKRFNSFVGIFKKIYFCDVLNSGSTVFRVASVIAVIFSFISKLVAQNSEDLSSDVFKE